MAKLRLNRETLSELAPDELAMVGGAVQQPTPPTPVVRTLPINDCIGVAIGATVGTCITQRLSLQCPSEPPTCYCTPMP